MGEPVEILSAQPWVKVVEMLQQNWAFVEPAGEGRVMIYFVNDRGGVFDQIEETSVQAADLALRKNGFKPFSSTPEYRGMMHSPVAPFKRATHPNGPIYSSGRFWRA